jgi:hypothetical protein
LRTAISRGVTQGITVIELKSRTIAHLNASRSSSHSQTFTSLSSMQGDDARQSHRKMMAFRCKRDRRRPGRSFVLAVENLKRAHTRASDYELLKRVDERIV